MLIDPATTSAVHHYLLIFVDSVAAFPTWQVVLAWYRIEIYARHLNENIVSCDVKFQILQVVMNIIYQYMNALITSAPYIEMLIRKV